MIQTKSLRIWMAVLAVSALHSSAFAASFDCEKATKPREKLVCSVPALSDLDTQLGRKYQERRVLLSSRGVALLQRSEQSWLSFISTKCPFDPHSGTDKRRESEICLEGRYRERLQQLSKVGQKLGPFVFNRIDLFIAAPADPASASGFSFNHASYPQIDNIDTPATETWNKLATKKLSDSEDCDEDVDYLIGYASDKIISTLWSNYTYCHGKPHGFGGSAAENFVLLPTPHKLDSTELFGLGNNWVSKLQALFSDALDRNGWQPVNDNAKNEILEATVDPERWLFTGEGIEVDFNSYEGGCYACTPQPVTVSWASLKPLLAPNSVLP